MLNYGKKKEQKILKNTKKPCNSYNYRTYYVRDEEDRPLGVNILC